MNNIISNCPLCEEHSLHLMGQGRSSNDAVFKLWLHKYI